MNRRTIFSICAMTTMALAMIPSGVAAQQKSLKDQLVGTWTLVSNEDTEPNGTKRQYFGANPRGIMILDAGGRYAQVAGRPDRPKFTASCNLRLNTPAAQYGEAARAFAGNFGTWSVNEADKTLTRRYEAAFVPNVEGADQKNSVSVVGDEMKLVSTSSAGLRTEAVYRRAK
jgi:Lipocalin-like domain